MKTITSILFALLLLSSARADDTNIWPTTLVANAKQSTTCVTPTYFYVAHASIIGPGSQSTNKWFYPTGTNHTISVANQDAVVSYFAHLSGHAACAKGTLTWTDDPAFPHETYRFGVNWSNNVVPVPTNGEVIDFTMTNFRTNAP